MVNEQSPDVSVRACSTPPSVAADASPGARHSAGRAFDVVLDALRANGRNVKERGSSTMAQCPAHDDGNESLSIKTRRDDKGVVLYCFAGCDYQAVLGALGLADRDLYDEPKTREEQWRPRRTVPAAPPPVPSRDRLQVVVERFGSLAAAGQGRAETHDDPLCAGCRRCGRLGGPQWWSQFCGGCATGWAPAEDIAEQQRWNSVKQAAVAISRAGDWRQVAQRVRSGGGVA